MTRLVSFRLSPNTSAGLVATAKEDMNMANLLVDERDVKFILYEQFKIDELCQFDRYAEFSREMFDMALEAAQKLAEKEIAPTNADGDAKGVVLEQGQVKVPESFRTPISFFAKAVGLPSPWIRTWVDRVFPLPCT